MGLMTLPNATKRWPYDGAAVELKAGADWLRNNAADDDDDAASEWQEYRAEAVKEVEPSD